MFYEHYPFKPDVEANVRLSLLLVDDRNFSRNLRCFLNLRPEQREMKYKMAISLDSRPHAESYKAYSLIDAKKLLPPGAEGRGQEGQGVTGSDSSSNPLCEQMTPFDGDADVTDMS